MLKNKKVIEKTKDKEIFAFEGAVPTFTPQQLSKQIEKQVKFLKAIYPFLEDNEWQNGGIELRPIKRSKELKYIRSFNCWRLQENDIKELYDFMEKGINGRPFCLYYSTYTFDNKVDVPTKQKDKINTENALFTTILVMDYDGMTYEEFLKHKQRLLDLGLETIDIYSGHGIQSIILLDKKVYDTKLLYRWTNLLIRKGFPVDPAIIDCARLFRMPYSFNCKAFDPNNKYYSANPTAVATTDVAWTEKRYSLVDVFRKIQSLEDVIPSYDGEDEKIEADNLIAKQASISVSSKKAEKEKKEKHILEVKNIKIEEVKQEYKILPDVEMLPNAFVKMLYRTPGGVRNETLLFLVPFLQNKLGLSIEKIKQVMKIWGSRCLPSFDPDFINSEVNRLLKYDYKEKYGLYTSGMIKAFGFFEFDQMKFTRENKVLIPNAIFNDMSTISDGAFRIYLSLLLDKSLNGQKNYSQEDICKLANIKRATFYKHIKDLTAFGYITKVKSSIAKKKGEEYIYYLNPYTSVRDGYTLIERATIKIMLIECTDAEIKLYAYLCKMLNSEAVVFASQKYLAEKIGKSQNRVSELTDSLGEKRYLTKTTEKIKNIFHSSYNLNY